MELFSKAKDPICGMKVEKKSSLKKFGRYFCSEKCAEEYGKTVKKAEKQDGCCGGH